MKELRLTNQTVFIKIWLAFGLAMATAAAYALIFFHVLPIGDYDWTNAPAYIGYAEPNVILSAGGLVSKILQIVLELAMIYLIFANKKKK